MIIHASSASLSTMITMAIDGQKLFHDQLCASTRQLELSFPEFWSGQTGNTERSCSVPKPFRGTGMVATSSYSCAIAYRACLTELRATGSISYSNCLNA